MLQETAILVLYLVSFALVHSTLATALELRGRSGPSWGCRQSAGMG